MKETRNPLGVCRVWHKIKDKRSHVYSRTVIIHQFSPALVQLFSDKGTGIDENSSISSMKDREREDGVEGEASLPIFAAAFE